MSDSQVTLVGNTVADFELRFTTGGRANGSTRIAVSRKWMNQAGEWQEETSFFNVVCWGTLAENCAASITKGTRVIVSGRLVQREYETKEGEKRSVVEVSADEIGPSLRWARCEVERITRDKPTNTRANRAPDPVYGDETF